jgi:pyruvate formate lyase activating enzyme
MDKDALLDKGLVFNIQRFSIQDGPGIRTTVFLKGCPLHCSWCSNPESIRSTPEIFLRVVKCIKCGKCQNECPEQAITVTKDQIVVDWKKCNSCLKCTASCPSKAIELVGNSMTVNEVMEIVLKDAGYYRHSGGGITLSGGEPLAQWQFATSLLMEAKRKGLHTAIETAGCAEWAAFAGVLRYTNLVLYDLKHVDPARHFEATGIRNDRILENLKKVLSETKVPTWIRIPVIPKFNDSREFMEKVCEFILNLPRPPEKVSLLPFHKFGAGKYQALGRAYEFEETPLISKEKIEEYKGIIESNGIKVNIGL